MKEVPEPSMEDVEWHVGWCEEASRLQYAEDYAGLVKWCQVRLDRDPWDFHALEAVANAHFLNQDPQQVIDLLAPHYQADPQHPFAETMILEALHKQGRPIMDFDWQSPPRVQVIDAELLNYCYRKLKPKRKPVLLELLWLDLEERGFPWFTQEEFLTALLSDTRFLVNDPIPAALSTVLVRREGRNRSGPSAR